MTQSAICELYREAVGSIDRMMSTLEDGFGFLFEEQPQLLREYSYVTNSLEKFDSLTLDEQITASDRALAFTRDLKNAIQTMMLSTVGPASTKH